MLSVKEVSLIFETLLSSPGMSDAVKIQFSFSRKNVLFLSKIIETGMLTKEKNTDDPFVKVMDEETINELKKLTDDLLKKSGLTEMNLKLQSLSGKN